MKNVILTAICVMFLSGVVLADWDRNEPAKYVQLPDMEPTGMDVKVGDSTIPGTNEPVKKVLADDFPCYQTNFITDIHIWGSWKGDDLPLNDGPAGTGLIAHPGHIVFKLGIWSDIPAVIDATGQVIEHSRPGELLWDRKFEPGQFGVRDAFPGPECWFDPNTGQFEPDNHQMAYQYNFFIDESEQPFEQKGTLTDRKVYWLSVDVEVLDIQNEAEFGWKTSHEHWNDDATFRDEMWVIDPAHPAGGFWEPTGPWREMIYPDLHPWQGRSVDMAFVITPEPATMTLLALGGLCILRRRRK